ncbi:MAG: DUF1015 domain-containing protein, partial [Gammaproteobacteria bacterium]
PYDVMNRTEAKAMVEGRPWSFLHISRPEIDLPDETDPYDPAVYAKGRENLDRMIAEGVLTRDPRPAYYAYRLTMGDHVQTGIVAAASVAAYDADRIKKHEFTRPVKEDDRVRQIDALNAQTGPVFLVYRADPVVDGILAEVTGQTPDMDVTAADGVRHEIWVIDDPQRVEALTRAFDAMDALYVADGHHRSAAASRVAAARKAANPSHTGEESYNYFLSVIFPHDQMQILDYNRVVRDLNGLSPQDFLAKIAERFDFEASEQPVRPREPGEFGMYLDGQWYRLRLRDEYRSDDPVKGLDVSLLADNLIEPVLGISDPRRDERIDFVGGIRGLGELEKRVDSGDWAVAFSLYPTSMEALMRVADAGEVMPPKSTWFEPKLADGLVSHVLD